MPKVVDEHFFLSTSNHSLSYFPDIEYIIAADQNVPEVSFLLPAHYLLCVRQLQLMEMYQKIHVLVLGLEDAPEFPTPLELNPDDFAMKILEEGLWIFHVERGGHFFLL